MSSRVSCDKLCFFLCLRFCLISIVLWFFIKIDVLI
ncbi:unnamed protein product [Brassica rapa subsp. narinosa]